MAWTREQIAERAAREMQAGFYVNLGIGIPTLMANYIPAGAGAASRSAHACGSAGNQRLARGQRDHLFKRSPIPACRGPRPAPV